MLLCNFSQVLVELLSSLDEGCGIQRTLGDLLCLSILRVSSHTTLFFIFHPALNCQASFVVETRYVLFLPEVESCRINRFHLAQVLLFKLSARAV